MRSSTTEQNTGEGIEQINDGGGSSSRGIKT
jgi:hypothetical protein